MSGLKVAHNKLFLTTHDDVVSRALSTNCPVRTSEGSNFCVQLRSLAHMILPLRANIDRVSPLFRDCLTKGVSAARIDSASLGIVFVDGATSVILGVLVNGDIYLTGKRT